MVKESEWKEKEENLKKRMKQFEKSIQKKKGEKIFKTNFEEPIYWTRTKTMTDTTTSSVFLKITENEVSLMSGSQPEEPARMAIVSFLKY